MTKFDMFGVGFFAGIIYIIVSIFILHGLEPTVQECETILNQNPEMCLSVCVDEFEKFGC